MVAAYGELCDQFVPCTALQAGRRGARQLFAMSGKVALSDERSHSKENCARKFNANRSSFENLFTFGDALLYRPSILLSASGQRI